MRSSPSRAGTESSAWARGSRLDRHTEIVACCRGPYRVLAFEAVAQLRARGFSARRLEDGFPEWKAAGLPVEVHSCLHIQLRSGAAMRRGQCCRCLPRSASAERRVRLGPSHGCPPGTPAEAA